MESLAQVRDALPGFTFNDYLRHAKLVDSLVPSAAPLRVAVLRSYTAEPLQSVLTLRLLLTGYRPTWWFGGYNQYVQEILDPTSALHAFAPQVILLLVRLEELVPEFVEHYSARPGPEWGDLLEAKGRELAGLAARAATELSA